MEKEIVEKFVGLFVLLEKLTPDPYRTFKLYGTIKEVTNESVVIFTDRLGVVRLQDVVSIRETLEKPRRRRNNNDY